MRERVVIIGPGRVGLALGHALALADEVDDLVYCGRRPDPPSHPLFNQGVARYVYGLEPPRQGTTAVFLTVTDDAIPDMAEFLSLQGPAPEGCPVFHCSGALSTDPLEPLHARGYQVGSFHPLLSIARPLAGAQSFAGAAVALSGEPEALIAGERLARALGARTIRIPTSRRVLYHASGVFASNYLLVLLDASRRLLVQAGVGDDDAVAALLPLVRSTLDNLEAFGTAEALTGPVSRGDAETVDLHLRTLDPRDQVLYRTLGREALEVVRETLPEEVAERLAHLLAHPD